MANSIQLPENPALAERVLENTLKEKTLVLQHGLIGKVFGSGPDASVRVAATVLIILAGAGVTYTFLAPDNAVFAVAEFWKILSPIISSLAGFIFGKSVK